jgi:hypothetical protein
MAKHPQYVWWNCLLCPFRMHDDGSLEAAQRMGQHIEVHEREEEERTFQKLALYAPKTAKPR